MTVARPSVQQRRWTDWIGPALTVAVVVLAQALSATSLRVPNPPALLVLLIVYSAFQGGVAAGFVSALIGWGYVAFFFATPGVPLSYTDENLRRVVLWALTMPATAALVGLLQRRAVRFRAAEERRVVLEEQMADRLQTEAALSARARQQAVVAELGRLALTDADVQQVFDQAATGVAVTFGIEFCKVLELLPDGRALRLVAGVGWRDGLIGTLIGSGADTQAGFTLRSKAPVVVGDLGSETRFRGPPLLLEHGVVSGLSVIIGEVDRPYGVLGIHTTHHRTFTADDANFLLSVANVLAETIQSRRSGEELRRATEHLANVTAVGPAVLYQLAVRDHALVPMWTSANVTDLTGDSVAQALEPDWWMRHIHPDDQAAANAVQAELVRPDARDRLSHEFRFVRSDGGMIWVRDETRVLRDGQGTPREIVGALTDVTERRQLAEQFLQAQKMDTVGRLAGGVAHDFNNLITVITNTADLAARDLRPDDPVRADLEEILRAAERAATLTRQLLAFSRRQILQLEVLNLNATLADMESLLPRVLGEDITLRIVRGAALGNVRADPGQLTQIIMNLAVNSRDAMPAGGTLTIETANVELDAAFARQHPGIVPGSYVSLAVTDTGQGMDETTRQRVFEPFFTTKAHGRGTGLGLSTVYGIVKQSGGYITVSSGVGRGTSFGIYFDRVVDPVPVVKVERSGEPAHGSETILLVEDQPAVRHMTKRILERLGYVVVTAADAGEALRVAEGHAGEIQLLLTDVVMPQMNGPALAERLSALRPRMKVLYMSGYAENAIGEGGVLDPGTAFIGKPFDTATMSRKIREVLDAAPASRRG